MDPQPQKGPDVSESSARKYSGIILLFVFIFILIGLLSAVTDHVRYKYTGEDKSALYTYIGISWGAIGFIIFTYIAVLFSRNAKIYLTLGIISFLLVITQILLSELYLPQQNITDDKVLQLVRISNLIVILTQGMLLGMSFQKPNQLFKLSMS